MINLANAALGADVVKIGALGNNGTLNIGGGSDLRGYFDQSLCPRQQRDG